MTDFVKGWTRTVLEEAGMIVPGTADTLFGHCIGGVWYGPEACECIRSVVEGLVDAHERERVMTLRGPSQLRMDEFLLDKTMDDVFVYLPEWAKFKWNNEYVHARIH